MWFIPVWTGEYAIPKKHILFPIILKRLEDAMCPADVYNNPYGSLSL